ncbi:hypothetical protein J2794_004487 [Paraburkholderia terricola]|nr:hypothetical protein [Paraburkholderia terricola]
MSDGPEIDRLVTLSNESPYGIWALTENWR